MKQSQKSQLTNSKDLEAAAESRRSGDEAAPTQDESQPQFARNPTKAKTPEQ